jgi:hypothetical protein
MLLARILRTKLILRSLVMGVGACAIAAPVLAEGFAFAIASPVASQNFAMKSAAFVFRTEGCAEPSKPQITATAEGMVKGARKSVVLKIQPDSRPNIYAVFQNWASDGDWIVNLKGTCVNATAGAIVPIGPKGFIRESAKFFPRPATDAEVEASLKALSSTH